MVRRLFVYGTLQNRGILYSTTGIATKGISAKLRGYRRYAIRHQDFPGIVKSAGDSVDGKLIHPFTRAQLEKLDRYEGAMYRRILVRVNLGNRSVLAWTYIINHAYRARLLKTDWDNDTFEIVDIFAYFYRIFGRRLSKRLIH